MAAEEKDILDSIDSSNIFDEFETWELKEEFHAKKSKEKKDTYDYISIAAWVLSTIFWIGLFLVGGFFWYVSIQENKELNNSSLLNPICSIIVWTTPLPNDSHCMSISVMDEVYNTKLTNLKDQQASEILSLLVEIYKTENFNKSKEVIFLNDRSKNKLKILSILNKFDNLKYNYDPLNMQRIQCNDFTITDDLMLKTSCVAFSNNYEKDIKWFDGTDNEKISGTSISVANSFLNYIDKQSDDFILIDRQKSFKSEGIFSEYTNFSKKTTFDLTLQYTNILTNK
jgi:hypothetical protein